MKCILLIAFIALISLPAKSLVRVILPDETDFPGLKNQGELFRRNGDVYIRSYFHDRLISKNVRESHISHPTITSRTTQANGIFEDLVIVGPGKIFIDNISYENTVALNCVYTVVGIGGRPSQESTPNSNWSSAFLYLVPDPNPTADRKFNCYLDQNENLGMNVSWIRYAYIQRVLDTSTTPNRFRNIPSISYKNFVDTKAANNIFGYGSDAFYFPSASKNMTRSANCRSVSLHWLTLGYKPERVSITFDNGDYTTLDFYSDSQCLHKVSSYPSAPANATFGPVTWPGFIYYKGTLNGANTGVVSKVTLQVFSYRNVLISNKDI